jgi:biotin carboxyl carrier protein
VGNGRYLVTTGDVSRLAYAVRSSAGTWVFIDGVVRLVGSDSGGATRRGTDDQTALAAPMPATVVAINVVPGQRVSKGDMLILLEAMKMELPIKTPRDGIIAAVHCNVGELVQPAVPLVALTD